MSSICKVKILKGLVLPEVTTQRNYENGIEAITPVTFVINSELKFNIVKQIREVQEGQDGIAQFTPTNAGEIVIEIFYKGITQQIHFNQNGFSLIYEKFLHVNLYTRKEEIGVFKFYLHFACIFNRKTGLLEQTGLASSNDIIILKNDISEVHFHPDCRFVPESDFNQDIDGVPIGNLKGTLYSDTDE